MTDHHLLAIDAGTGSCRAVLFDSRIRQIGVAQREWTHHATAGVPGGQDFAVETNWALIADCVHQVLAESGTDPRSVAGVASTSMREGIVLFDAAGVELWACPNVDSRASREAAELVTAGQATTIYELSGDWVSITSPARLRWLARNRPDIMARTASVALLSDWIAYRLCGVLVSEPSCGSSSGMFDLAARTWSPQIAAICGLPDSALPPVRESGTRIGSVTSPAAADTGLAAGTAVMTGGGDTQLALAGVGAAPGELTIVGGTFWQTTVLLDKPTIDPGRRLRTLCHSEPNQWMLEGIGFYTGYALRWLRDAFCDPEVQLANVRGVDPYVVMEEIASTVPPGSNGLVAVLSNVMNAQRWVHASPSFVQFDLTDPAATGRAACVRAVEEAAAYVVRAHRDLLYEVAASAFDRAVFTGGAAKGILWPQIVADVLGTPVDVPLITESSAVGAALAASHGVGLAPSAADVRGLRDRARTVHPDPHAIELYDAAYLHWADIYRSQLDISEAGILRPLWRAAGADAASPSRTASP